MSVDSLAKASEILPDIISLRRKIHANPELGNQLPDTKAAVIDALSDCDLDIRYSKETTGLVVTLNGVNPGPRIMLRADMDALPMPEDNDLEFASKNHGKMHACGHDAHAAMLVGAVKILYEQRRKLSGSVDFFFQTGEEGHYGAKVAIDEGLFDAPNQPDAVFAIHITPLLDIGKVVSKAGPMLAAADTWQIEVMGKGGHASMPHDCLDPVPVACEIVQALQGFVTRRINPFDPVVLTTTMIEAGTTSNVIPESARLTGTLRSTSEKSRSIAHEGIERIARKIAEAYEMEVNHSSSYGYPVTINDEKFTRFAKNTAIGLLGEEGYIESKSPMMGAEDFSYFLQRWPGAMFFLGVKPDDASLAVPCHSNRMILNEQGMAHGSALYAEIAINFLKGA
ncbi:MAG TPA: M20 family metallopeptidase [Pseudomonadales bacterium]|mgnify:CR=1 FL=1|jgi:hippurate hydrolase|nr:amidohydrolase [Gammaproteobacteria bacterium]MDP6025115.1 M20 family metallopeptidase [Pseudomonadales bacterium]MDP6315640.1 M20 family metallopeptidase [Pseudomonadales bacterium]MDP7313552.1 M20 family metallopeptidase [Pseudomonadales bacterium]HJL60411.1 M20 family metallopeptidase [Pseudomonadales bacterium]|tara:strand:+ start:7664 stop:8851 length:1188 start_codon:yes stop_codon:yes gene_type:complete